jgi:hypothetical protein
VAKYKEFDYSQGKFIPIHFDKQILPGTFEQQLVGSGLAMMHLKRLTSRYLWTIKSQASPEDRCSADA